MPEKKWLLLLLLLLRSRGLLARPTDINILLNSSLLFSISFLTFLNLQQQQQQIENFQSSLNQ